MLYVICSFFRQQCLVIIIVIFSQSKSKHSLTTHTCPHVHAITSDKQWRINGFGGMLATPNETEGKCMSPVTSDLLPRHLQVKASTIFSKVGVHKSVFARRLHGLDHFTWIINQLGILEGIDYAQFSTTGWGSVLRTRKETWDDVDETEERNCVQQWLKIRTIDCSCILLAVV